MRNGFDLQSANCGRERKLCYRIRHFAMAGRVTRYSQLFSGEFQQKECTFRKRTQRPTSAPLAHDDDQRRQLTPSFTSSTFFYLCHYLLYHLYAGSRAGLIYRPNANTAQLHMHVCHSGEAIYARSALGKSAESTESTVRVCRSIATRYTCPS